MVTKNNATLLSTKHENKLWSGGLTVFGCFSVKFQHASQIKKINFVADYKGIKHVPYAHF